MAPVIVGPWQRAVKFSRRTPAGAIVSAESAISELKREGEEAVDSEVDSDARILVLVHEYSVACRRVPARGELPGDQGEVPDGYYTYRSPTFGNILLWRGFLVEGDPQPGVASMKQHIRIYPLARRESPPEQRFVNLSGRAFNTIHANDFTFFEEVHQVVQEEPAEGIDPEILGLLASIGIEKGKPFAPDARMKAILTDAAAVGNATARATIFATRIPESYIYEGSAWKTGFIGGSHEFMRDGVRLLDGRTLFYYYATMVTPAMAAKMVGVGAQYAGAAVDADGKPLDGGRTYRLNLPAGVPAKDFWSLVIYWAGRHFAEGPTAGLPEAVRLAPL